MTGSGAVIAYKGGELVANDTGAGLQIDVPGTKRAFTISGSRASAASSAQGFAFAYSTDDGAPTLSLVDLQLTRETVVPLGVAHSVRRRFTSPHPPVAVSWDPSRSEWLVAWESSESLTKSEIARLVRQKKNIPFGIRVARIARVSPTGQVLSSRKLAETTGISNLVWTGKEHAMILLRRRATTWKLTLVAIRAGRVVRRTALDDRASCSRLYKRAVWLAWTGSEHIGLALDRGDSEETPRLSAVRFAKSKQQVVELVVQPGRRLGPARIRGIGGHAWLVFASADRELGRSLVYAAALDDRLEIGRTLVIDDGFDRVFDLDVFRDGARLKAAIFRDKRSSVVTLPKRTAVKELASVATDRLRRKLECLPDREPGRRFRTHRSHPRPPLPFRLQLQSMGGHHSRIVRRNLAEGSPQICLLSLPSEHSKPIRARFVINLQGKVLQVQLDAAELDDGIRRCLKSAIKQSRYPAANELTKVAAEWIRR